MFLEECRDRVESLGRERFDVKDEVANLGPTVVSALHESNLDRPSTRMAADLVVHVELELGGTVAPETEHAGRAKPCQLSPPFLQLVNEKTALQDSREGVRFDLVADVEQRVA
jgi:hypothetical protein